MKHLVLLGTILTSINIASDVFGDDKLDRLLADNAKVLCEVEGDNLTMEQGQCLSDQMVAIVNINAAMQAGGDQERLASCVSKSKKVRLRKGEEAQIFYDAVKIDACLRNPEK